MKPPGLAFELDPIHGSLRLRVDKATQAQDLIWEAVSEARLEGMTPEQFKWEVAQAWEQDMDDEKKSAIEELNR